VSNGLSIEVKTQEDAIELARKYPQEALGYTMFNLVQLKKRCDCQQAACDNRYVLRQWIKERKYLVAGIFIGVSIVQGGAILGVAKLLSFL
jgi:hypothetical protein